MMWGRQRVHVPRNQLRDLLLKNADLSGAMVIRRRKASRRRSAGVIVRVPAGRHGIHRMPRNEIRGLAGALESLVPADSAQFSISRKNWLVAVKGTVVLLVAPLVVSG